MTEPKGKRLGIIKRTSKATVAGGPTSITRKSKVYTTDNLEERKRKAKKLKKAMEEANKLAKTLYPSKKIGWIPKKNKD